MRASGSEVKIPIERNRSVANSSFRPPVASSTAEPTTSGPHPEIKEGLVEAMTSAYATLIRRQRNASAAFVRWTSPHKRAHEFAWIEPGKEALMFAGRDIRVGPTSTEHESLNKMMATIALNPYERELLYG